MFFLHLRKVVSVELRASIEMAINNARFHNDNWWGWRTVWLRYIFPIVYKQCKRSCCVLFSYS